MERKTRTKISISFSYINGRIRVGYGLLEALGFPEYVKLLINKSNAEIAIRSSTKEDRDSLKINYGLSSIYIGAFLCTKLFIEAVYIVANWDFGCCYLINEFEKGENGSYIFDTNKAKISNK